MRLPYFFYLSLLTIVIIQQAHAFDDTHIKERIEEMVKNGTPVCIKTQDDTLTKALLTYVFKNGNVTESPYEIGYAYQATKSGIRLTTCLEATPLKEQPLSLFGIEIPETATVPTCGYVYDNKTLCMYFMHFNAQFQKKCVCSCNTSMQPGEIEEFLEGLHG